MATSMSRMARRRRAARRSSRSRRARRRRPSTAAVVGEGAGRHGDANRDLWIRPGRRDRRLPHQQPGLVRRRIGPSKLPAFQDEFGHNGHTWFSARQSRFGAKASIPTSSGKDIKVVFDWDLFGVGVDAGQTTIRPRHMYGQWGDFGGGQLESPFMDLDVFPNILEYWGPNGMLFYRNVQVFWQPIHRDNGTRVTLALERPGASGDAGVLADRIELQSITPRFPAPGHLGEYRLGGKFGYAKLGAIVRWIRWDDSFLTTHST